MADFSNILNRNTATIEKPKPLPVGSYICIIKPSPEQGESQQKKTPYLRFEMQPVMAGEDVDADAFEAAGGQEKLSKSTLTKDFYLTEDALFRLVDFCKAAGVTTDNRPLGEAVADTAGQQVLVYIDHRLAQDGENVYTDIKKITAVA